MAIQINVYQDKRRESNNLFYGRSVKVSTIDLEALAERIEANTTAKKADVKAVLTELVEVMNLELANSNQIHLDGFGYFYPSIRTRGAMTKQEWTIADCLKDGRVRFREEFTLTRNPQTGKSQLQGRSLSSGWKYSILDLVEKPKTTPQP